MKRRRRRRRPSPWGALQPPGEAMPDDGGDELGAAIAQLEGAIAALRQRYEQIRANQTQQQTLQAQRSDPSLSPTELADLEAQLHRLEADLESSLLTWETLAEPFWQAVRFGGLGVIIGWVLARMVGS